jgi:hypothetical protein
MTPARIQLSRAKALDDVAAERKRQIEAEGCTPKHDDMHRIGDLAMAGAAYAASAAGDPFTAQDLFPWSRDWLKPTTRAATW